jgi:lipopolysaccharide export system protein LptC
MNARFYDRVAAVVSLLLLLLLAAGTTWLAQQAASRQEQSGLRKITHEPDYFVEGLQFTRVNARGEAAYRMSAKRLEHYPDDDSVSFVLPVLVSMDTSKPQITVRADKGRSSSEGVETELFGNVVLTRQAQEQTPAMKISTEYALLLSNEDIVRSPRPVKIEYGLSSLDGVGMEFNNNLRTLRVDAQVRGTWQPSER